MARRFVTREFGTSLNFNSTTHQITTAGGDWLGTGNLTIAGWINPVNLGASNLGRIIDNSKLIVRLSATNTLSASNDGSTFVTAATNSISFRKWIFVTVTRTSAGVLNFFINGTQSGTANQSGGTPTAGGTVYIGNNNSARNFTGLIDSLVVFNSILTQAQISELFYSGVKRINPIAEYLMNEGGGSTVADTGSNGNLGTITGATFVISPVIRQRMLTRDFGSSLYFSTATDRVDCGALDFIGAGNTTCAFWFKPNSLGAGGGGRVIDNGKYIISMASTNGVNLRSDGNTNATSGNVIKLREWQFMAVTRTLSGVANWYLNGLPVGTANQSSGTPATGSTNVYIGNTQNGSRNFDGNIDNLQLYPKILTATEIYNIWRSGVKPSQPSSEYLCNEGSGPTLTDTGTSLKNGTITGSASFSSDVVTKRRTLNITRRFRNRGFGYSLFFPGSSYVNISDSTSLRTLKDNYTVAFWIRMPNLIPSGAQEIITSRTTENHFLFRRETDNKISWFDWTGGGSSVQIKTTLPITDQGWHFVVGVKTPTSIKLYLDDVLQSTGVTSGTITYSSGKINIGSNNANVSALLVGCYVDSIRMWSRTLSTSDMTNLFKSGTYSSTGIVGEWLCNEGSGTTLLDSSGNSNTGTITAATYQTTIFSLARSTV